MTYPSGNVDPSNYAKYNSVSNSNTYELKGNISNIAAASRGGRRKRRRKSSRKNRSRKNRSRKNRSRKNRSRKNRSIRYRGGGLCQVGGLSSVTNINHGYSVGPPVQLTWNESALANPSPYTENLAYGQTLNVI
jgi:hypothetical protein